MITTPNRLKALCNFDLTVKINKQFGKINTLKVAIDQCKKINIDTSKLKTNNFLEKYINLIILNNILFNFV